MDGSRAAISFRDRQRQSRRKIDELLFGRGEGVGEITFDIELGGEFRFRGNRTTISDFTRDEPAR